MSVSLCSAPSRLSYGPSWRWRTKDWPARGLGACFGGRECCVLFIVLWRDPGVLWGGELCPLWHLLIYQFVEYPWSWEFVACLSGNGAAVGDWSVGVRLGFSVSSKIYAGPHPVLSVHCIPWCPPLGTISQVQWISIIKPHSLVPREFCCCWLLLT